MFSKTYSFYFFSFLALFFIAAYTFIAPSATLKEDFEAGSKGGYDKGNVSLGSGNWSFDDAMLGNMAEDRKKGSKSVRIRNRGKLTMQFDKTNGAGSFQVAHGSFGKDAGGSWELWVSADQGKSWKKTGNTVSSGSASLQTASIAVNISGKVRFEIRKVSGDKARINLDDISITDFGSGAVVTDNRNNGDQQTERQPNDNQRDNNAQPGKASKSIHLAPGNPSGAGTDPKNYLIEKPQYALSYNRDRGIANWVSWYLDDAWMGDTKRQNDFRPDNSLPSGWYQVSTNDYSGSGFDRGHYCASGDRTAKSSDNSATFLMTNIMPQAADNNQGPWEKLESYCRDLAQQGKRLYIICGSYGTGGTGLKGYKTTIAGGKITVPAQTWKVVVVLPSGKDISSIDASTRIIAIDMPNKQGIREQSWGDFRVSVDAVEQKTGYDLLSALPKNVQDQVEAKTDRAATN